MNKPITKSFQDMPPPGGYPEINYKRGARARGPSGLAIWTTIGAMTVYGFYWIGITNAERRANLKEQRDARMAILPYLVHEEDKIMTEKIKLSNSREAEIMKNVPGWKVGANCYSKRWVAPTDGIK